MDPTPLQVSTATQYGTPAVLGSVIEGAEVVRSDLLRAERALRVLSHDAAELAPMFAARLNVAAHLVHNAASAVSPEGPIHAK